MRTDYTPAIQAALESGSYGVANVLSINSTTPIYLTDHHHSIPLNSNTYQPIKGASKFPNITESMQNKKGTHTIELPNVDRIWDSIIQTEGFIDKWVSVGKVIFDASDNVVGLMELWAGVATKAVTHDKKVKLSAASYHSIFEKISGIKTNVASYQRHLTEDERTYDRTMDWAGTASQFKVSS